MNRYTTAAIATIALSGSIYVAKHLESCDTLTLHPKHNLYCIKVKARDTIRNPILADLVIAQAILESNLGGKPSGLALKGNNLFGIKGKGTCGSIKMQTWEVIRGKKVTVMADFAKFCTLEDGLQKRKAMFDLPRYKNLYQATSFEDAANRIRKSGYATDPAYSKKLVEIYNEYIKNK